MNTRTNLLLEQIRRELLAEAASHKRCEAGFHWDDEAGKCVAAHGVTPKLHQHIKAANHVSDLAHNAQSGVEKRGMHFAAADAHRDVAAHAQKKGQEKLAQHHQKHADYHASMGARN